MFLRSLIACSLFHEVATLVPSRVRYAANLRTCIAFQLYFLWRAGSLLIASYQGVQDTDTTQWITSETMRNLEALAGYFVYDLCFLLQTSPFSGFVLHHLIGLGMIGILREIGPPSAHLLTAYNALCVVAEVTNPPLNLRHFLKGTRWEGVNRQVIFWTYTVCRMIMYPWMSYRLYQHVRCKGLLYLCFAVYGMSIIWYRRVIRMTWMRS